MRSVIDFYKTRIKGGGTMGYTIYDDDNKIIAVGYGFVTHSYLEQSISMRMRALKGLRPLHYGYKEATPHSMAIVQNWNDQIYGKENRL